MVKVNTYSAKALVNNQEKIVKKYSHSVNILAKTIYNKINFLLPLEDLQQIGYTGLLEAVKRQSELREQNQSYYETCIKGKILDELRKNDHLTQKDRELINQIEKEKNISLNESNEIKPQEISKKLNVDVSKYYELQSKNQMHKLLSIEDLQSKNELDEDVSLNSFNLEDNYQKHEIKKLLIKAIKTLNYNEQIILQLIYYEDCSFAEVSQVLDMSKTKVFSIHNSCIEKIKKTLNIK